MTDSSLAAGSQTALLLRSRRACATRRRARAGFSPASPWHRGYYSTSPRGLSSGNPNFDVIIDKTVGIYGDTFPHYRSALTACCYEAYAEITEDDSYRTRAEAAYRGVLSRWASLLCLRVSHHGQRSTVNGQRSAARIFRPLRQRSGLILVRLPAPHGRMWGKFVNFFWFYLTKWLKSFIIFINIFRKVR